ncbi:hypothetical protein [Streptomyces platensis]|uniref:hypothetical protein n=1 Tax=Streptomyces platensis TaxID=58346 RepID=UPI00378BDE83
MPMPQPLSADQIPDGSNLEAFNMAYRAAKRAEVPFVCVMRGSRNGWTVKLDVLSAPVWKVHVQDADLMREALVCLVRERIVNSGASAGPEYIALHGVANEKQARQLASGLHATLYGKPERLRALLPPSFRTAEEQSAQLRRYTSELVTALWDTDQSCLSRLTPDKLAEHRALREQLRDQLSQLWVQGDTSDGDTAAVLKLFDGLCESADAASGLRHS